jgi:hypothetical protein
VVYNTHTPNLKTVKMSSAPGTLRHLCELLENRASCGDSQCALMDYINELGETVGYQIHYDEFSLDEFSLDPQPQSPEDLGPNDETAPPHTEEEAGQVSAAAAAGPPKEEKSSPEEEATPPKPPAEAISPGEPDGAPGPATGATAKKELPTAEELPEGITTCDVSPQPVKVDEDGHVHIYYEDPALREREPAAGGYMGAISSGSARAGRVILSCGRGNILDDPILASECNGVVFDAHNWTPLVVPPQAFVPQPTSKYINQNIDKGNYTIIQVSDGTMVNIYQWEHPVRGKIWCMSSRNGYDVSHLRWMGRLTYAEILYELLARHPEFVKATGMTITHDYLCMGDTRLNFETLDPKKCYTIGFRCHRYHPLRLDPEAVWNVQSVDVKSGDVFYDVGLPHIPNQMVYSPGDINRLLGRGESKPIRLGDLEELNKASLDSACSAIAQGCAPAILGEVPAGTYATPFRYGFILRANDPSVCNVMCDSELLHTVRRLVYQRAPRSVRDKLNENNRLEYYALKAYLSVENREVFLQLYPQFAKRFDMYRTFIQNVAQQVHHMHRQSDMQQDAVAVEATEPTTATKTIARAILNAIRRSPGPPPRATRDDPATHVNKPEFSAFQTDTKSIIRDYVQRPEYVLIYLFGMKDLGDDV